MKKRSLAAILIAALLLTACGNGAVNGNNPDASTGSPSATPTTAPTATVAPTATTAPTATPTPSPTPLEPYNAAGAANVLYSTIQVDGEIDEAWAKAPVMVPELYNSLSIEASVEFKAMWDETALYCLALVTDPTLDKTSPNPYEQDSFELFLDELNDKATSYQGDDVHYRVNYDNETSTDSGDPTRFITAAKPYKNDAGEQIGYIIEASCIWSTAPDNDTVMGFELQINDGKNGFRLGTINVFDTTGNAWSSPANMGELILTGRDATQVAPANPSQLKGYLAMVENFNLEGYANPEILDEPIASTKALLEKEGATQKEYDDAFLSLQTALAGLNDGSGFTSPAYLTLNAELPDTLTFLDGSKVTAATWEQRAKEISELYQYYMYGVKRDGSEETLTYTATADKLEISIERAGNTASFPVTVSIPDKDKVPCPEGGWPVILVFGWLSQVQYANDHGYAVIVLDPSVIAADNLTRAGAFYTLYPYGKTWTEQTGALMAWGWGFSKILDALEAGAGEEYNINPANNIVTGVSRYGKAAAVAGAFDSRIKVCAPACSGAGGMATFRYMSVDNTYDLTSVGGPAAYKMTSNEPLSSLQASGERHWFNDTFLNISSVEAFPFDQYMLASLCADEDRYLFIIAAYQSEDWTNSPSMYLTYLKAKETFDFLGLSDHIAIQMHREGHAVIDEDMVYLIDFCNRHFYGIEPENDLSKLETTAYALEVNREERFYTLLGQ